jgi:hypothetical protein
MSQAELASRVGLKQQSIGEMERGMVEGSPKVPLIAKALGVKISFIDPAMPDDTSIPMASVVGYVGAGSEAHYYSNADSPDDEVPAPPGSNGETVAVEIRGTSLGSMFDRWLVFYDEKRDPPTLDMLRKLCVVGLTDGRVLVKQIMLGSIEGHFHLLSQTEGMIENVVIEWAAVVRAIAPR